MNTLQKLYAFALNPWVVVISLAAGFGVGAMVPELGARLAFVGDIYVDLLKMIALPFMVSAVIFSLQRLFREGGAGSLMNRVVVVFAAASALVAILGAATSLLMSPGNDMSAETMRNFGTIVGKDLGDAARALATSLLSSGGELVTLVFGDDAPPELCEGFPRWIESTYPVVDVVTYDGGQPLWPLIMGVE